MQRPRENRDNLIQNSVHQLLLDRHGPGTSISYETFIDTALYAPGMGYYRKPIDRIGYREGRDFYTASSLGNVFADLVVEAAQKLLGPQNPSDFIFTEIGAEPDKCLLSGVDHPFASIQPIGCGDEIELSGNLIVFSNELFDAQPFRRFRSIEGQWQEIGVNIGPDFLQEAVLELQPKDLPALPHAAKLSEGYTLDFPSGANQLAEAIVRQQWNGIFIAFDYGLGWTEISQGRPHGSGRTYLNHRMGSHLLESPGNCDITHHICWDHIGDILQAGHFSTVELQSQESFLMQFATDTIGDILTRDPTRFSPERQTLKELLSPQLMGRKFQVMWGKRKYTTA